MVRVLCWRCLTKQIVYGQSGGRRCWPSPQDCLSIGQGKKSKTGEIANGIFWQSGGGRKREKGSPRSLALGLHYNACSLCPRALSPQGDDANPKSHDPCCRNVLKEPNLFPVPNGFSTHMVALLFICLARNCLQSRTRRGKKSRKLSRVTRLTFLPDFRIF